MSSIHETYMQRAISLAQKGTRLAYPNPSVGAVIVCNDKIIGEGYTDAYGGPHAEVNAIASVKDKSLLSTSTMYVTLEPCAHYGKTPPCANLIEANKIPKIYIGCVDTFAKVAGKGIEILLRAGREVHVGILEDECIELHKRFFTYHNKKRPHIVLKWAETQDGFIDKERDVQNLEDAKPTWISNELSKQKVHQIRSTEHAIMVGTNTALKDNPTLTTRTFGGVSPIRILIDRSLRVPKNYHLYNGEVKTIIFTEQEATSDQIIFKRIDFSKNILPQVMEVLYQEKIQSVLVEGGKQLLDSFIEEDLWDEAFVFVGSASFKNGVKSPNMIINPKKAFTLGDNTVKYYNHHS